MRNAAREEQIRKIHAMEIEAEKSGPIHRRDLYRAIKRMRKELKKYDALRARA